MPPSIHQRSLAAFGLVEYFIAVAADQGAAQITAYGQQQFVPEFVRSQDQGGLELSAASSF